MEIVIGFLIAVAIGLTGVGGGTITVPVLILFLGSSPTQSVGTALAFTAIVKLVSVPVYLYRKQVDWKILALLVLGGAPGVIGGSFLIQRLNTRQYQGLIYGLLGAVIATMAILNLYRLFRHRRAEPALEHRGVLPAIGLGIGVEVGFSSAGAGALGSLALLQLTKLTAANVVGTDVCFGLVLSLLGSGVHLMAGNYDPALLGKLAIGGVLGAIVGANIVHLVPARPLRVAMLMVIAGLGLNLLWHGL